MTHQAHVAVGDRFDDFGDVWEITRMRRRGPDRVVYEVDAKRGWRDAFGKESFFYKTFHVSALASMRKISTR